MSPGQKVILIDDLLATGGEKMFLCNVDLVYFGVFKSRI